VRVLPNASPAHHREELSAVLDEATAAFHKARLDLIRADRAALGIPQTDGVTWISNSTEARRVRSPV
jgi:hypothetical protein